MGVEPLHFSFSALLSFSCSLFFSPFLLFLFRFDCLSPPSHVSVYLSLSLLTKDSMSYPLEALLKIDENVQFVFSHKIVQNVQTHDFSTAGVQVFRRQIGKVGFRVSSRIAWFGHTTESMLGGWRGNGHFFSPLPFTDKVVIFYIKKMEPIFGKLDSRVDPLSAKRLPLY